MYNKELIRKALLGDKQAQKECTEKGIVLPCPICGGEIKIKQCDWDMFYPYCNGCKFTFNFLFDSKKDAIEVVNDRPAPPIGRCGECKYGRKFSENDSQHDFHWEETEIFIICKEPYICTKWEVKTLHKPDEYCSYFEPRED